MLYCLDTSCKGGKSLNNILRIFILLLGISCFLIILKLLVKKKIGERASLLWLFGALVILIASFVPGLLDEISSLVGIDYPPSLLFLLSTLILFIICFMHSVQISTLNAQLRELTQHVAVKEICQDNMMNIKHKEIIETSNAKDEEDIKTNDYV